MKAVEQLYALLCRLHSNGSRANLRLTQTRMIGDPGCEQTAEIVIVGEDEIGDAMQLRNELQKLLNKNRGEGGSV